MSAVISKCENYRYRLDRKVIRDTNVLGDGVTFAFFGINPSTADASIDDQTVKKWMGFTERNRGSRFIVGNAFAFRSVEVKDLATANNPVGIENDFYIDQIISEAHILVPCWGNITKAPKSLRYRFNELKAKIFDSGKPVKIFGLTNSSCPKHPMMLSYKTKLIDW